MACLSSNGRGSGTSVTIKSEPLLMSLRVFKSLAKTTLSLWAESKWDTIPSLSRIRPVFPNDLQFSIHSQICIDFHSSLASLKLPIWSSFSLNLAHAFSLNPSPKTNKAVLMSDEADSFLRFSSTSDILFSMVAMPEFREFSRNPLSSTLVGGLASGSGVREASIYSRGDLNYSSSSCSSSSSESSSSSSFTYFLSCLKSALLGAIA